MLGVPQTVLEISSQFWAHKNWRPNFDELAKKITKPQFDKTVSIHFKTLYFLIRL